MKRHIHDYCKWIDIGAVETFVHVGGAMVQTCTCIICGKRKYRRTNSIKSSDVGVVRNLMSTFKNKMVNED